MARRWRHCSRSCVLRAPTACIGIGYTNRRLRKGMRGSRRRSVPRASRSRAATRRCWSSRGPWRRARGVPTVYSRLTGAPACPDWKSSHAFSHRREFRLPNSVHRDRLWTSWGCARRFDGMQDSRRPGFREKPGRSRGSRPSVNPSSAVTWTRGSDPTWTARPGCPRTCTSARSGRDSAWLRRAMRYRDELTGRRASTPSCGNSAGANSPTTSCTTFRTRPARH